MCTRLIKNLDTNNPFFFSIKFAQFGGSLAESAIRQQQDLHNAFAGLAAQMSVDADIDGDGISQWPFFWPPQFEHTAQDFFRISKCEWVGINNIVRHDQRDAFVNFTTAHFRDAYKLSHMIRYGNLDRLDDNITKYQGKITRAFYSNGTLSFPEDEVRDYYMVRTMQSPPPRDYSKSHNWNLNTSSSQRAMAAFSTLSAVPGATIFWDASKPGFQTVSKEEHMGYHTDDSAEHPHTYTVHPFYHVAGNTSSELVAWAIAYFAWDSPLRNLLPVNVQGLLVVIANDCNNTFSYLINGRDAIFQGWNDTHDTRYNDMALHVDLSLNANPELRGRVGHCTYRMVSLSRIESIYVLCY